MTLPKLPNISLDDIQKRPLVVIIALLVLLCGFLFTRLDKGGSRELEAAVERASACEERYDRLVTQVLLYANIIEEQKAVIDSAKEKSEREIKEILQ